jgi:hypothetical protein
MIDYKTNDAKKNGCVSAGHLRYCTNDPFVDDMWRSEMEFGQWHDIVGKYELNGKIRIEIPHKAEYFRIENSHENILTKNDHGKERFFLVLYDISFKNARKIPSIGRTCSTHKPKYIEISVRRPKIVISKKWDYSDS